MDISIGEVLYQRLPVYLELRDKRGLAEYRVRLTLPQSQSGKIDVVVPILHLDEAFTIGSAWLVTPSPSPRFMDIMKLDLTNMGTHQHLPAGSSLQLSFPIHLAPYP